jgi:hypothetical protein
MVFAMDEDLLAERSVLGCRERAEMGEDGHAAGMERDVHVRLRRMYRRHASYPDAARTPPQRLVPLTIVWGFV